VRVCVCVEVSTSRLLQLISSLPEVEVCVVALHGGQRLLAFVVASAAERGEVVRPSAPPPDGDLRRLILNQLSLLLPSHSIPDTLVLVPALSMTPHGEQPCFISIFIHKYIFIYCIFIYLYIFIYLLLLYIYIHIFSVDLYLLIFTYL